LVARKYAVARAAGLVAVDFEADHPQWDDLLEAVRGAVWPQARPLTPGAGQ
jgi:hypothetical protein